MYLANGYAAAFVINSQRAVDSQIIGLVKQTQDRIKHSSGVLTKLSAQISSRLAQNLSAADLQSQSQSAQARLQAFTGTLQNACRRTCSTSPVLQRIGTHAEVAVQTAPSVKRDLIAGVAIGLIVALGLIFLLEALDRKVRSSEEVSEQLGLGHPRPDPGTVPIAPAAGSGSSLLANRLARTERRIGSCGWHSTSPTCRPLRAS